MENKEDKEKEKEKGKEENKEKNKEKIDWNNFNIIIIYI